MPCKLASRPLSGANLPERAKSLYFYLLNEGLSYELLEMPLYSCRVTTGRCHNRNIQEGLHSLYSKLTSMVAYNVI